MIPSNTSRLEFLALDFHPLIGETLSDLVRWLTRCESLREVSLGYCQLDQQSATSLSNYLMSANCKLNRLNLEGNQLKNEGVKIILRFGLTRNTFITHLNLANNRITGNLFILGEIVNCINKVRSLKTYVQIPVCPESLV